MMRREVKIKMIPSKTGGEMKKPEYATPGSAAFDLYACLDEPETLKPRGIFLVPTGIAAAIPGDCAGFVFARSGLSTKHGIALANGVGVVDSDYRGEIKVALVNLSDVEYTVNPGDRIAQMAVMPVCRAVFSYTDELDETMRGGGGFGSTGK